MLRKVPNYIKYLFTNALILFIFAFLFRIIFYSFFAQLETVESEEIRHAFALGIRFDIKFAVLAVFPIAILIFVINQRFFKYKIYKKIGIIYFTLIYIISALFYCIDFGYYDYLNTRLDSASLRFLSNFKISMQVLVESYPVFKGLLGLLILAFLAYKLNRYLYQKFSKNNQMLLSKKKKALYIVVPFLLLAYGVYNSVTHYPLRWSEAFFSKNQSVNQFALNPILYFYDSFAFRSTGFDLDATKKYYPTIAKYLNLPKDTLLFQRKVVQQQDSVKQKPNVVIVMMESVGVAPVSYFGNPIKTTPKLDSIAKKSALFTNFYVHKVGTAASVFASVTGLPDVETVKTASRNPMIIDQRIVFDQFKGYQKMYFLGGSANWANIRGVFQSNINDLQIFEEGSYPKDNRADVWGIDDYDLFKEANKRLAVLNQQKKPFVAYIQTASNHMPFTVPDKKGSYTPWKDDKISPALLKKSGFKSVAQINALRYLDFNIDTFLKRAKKAGYYDNTIFVFFGDHNTAMKTSADYLAKKEFELGTQVHHVPFIINAPKFIKPQVISKYGKLVDLFPTAAGLAKINYTNYTLGSNLLDSTAKKPFAFLYHRINGEPAVAVLQNDFYYTFSIPSKKGHLYRISSGQLTDIKQKYPLISKQLDSLTRGYYNATKYLYYNNKKIK